LRSTLPPLPRSDLSIIIHTLLEKEYQLLLIYLSS
jgi:hypothetical protein